MPKKIILLGSSGLLGNEFKKYLADSDLYELNCINRNDFDVISDSFESLTQIISDFNPDYIINCLAFTDTGKAEDAEYMEECFRINAFFPISLSEYCENNNIKIIHFSSDFVYGGYEKDEFSEDDPASPLNNYGYSKAVLENSLNARNYQNTAIFRTAWLFGGDKSNFVLNITKLMRERGELSVVDDQIVCLTSTDQVLESVVGFLDNFKSGIYNCVSDEPLSLYEIAFIAIKCKLGSEYASKIERSSLKDYESNVRRPAKVILKNNKLPKIGNIKHKIEQYISKIEL